MKHFSIVIEGDCPDDVPDEWLDAVAASAEVQVAEPEVWVTRDPHNPTSFDVSNVVSTVVIT